MSENAPANEGLGRGSYLSNTVWLLIGRTLRMLIGLGVGVWVARYLGPGDFGILSYALSLAMLGSALAMVGLDSMVVRELVNRRESQAEILGTAFGLRLIAGGVVWLSLVLFVALPQSDERLRWLLVVVGADTVLQSVNVIDLYFQSRVRSRYVVWAGLAAMFIAAGLRIAFIATGVPVVWFGVAFVVEAALLATGLVAFFRYQGREASGWKFSRRAAKALLTDSWPLIISGAAISAYMRIDQIMIKGFMDERAVGIYAAASRISEAWYFVPMMIGATLHPWIVEGRSLGRVVYERRLVKLYALLGWGAVIIATAVTLVGPVMIGFLFGPDYALAGGVLRVHVWAGVFLALGIAAGKWFIAENLTRSAMWKALFGLTCNVVGNYWLIPLWGLQGAAVATIAGHFAANLLYDFIDPRVRCQLVLKIRALALWNVLRP